MLTNLLSKFFLKCINKSFSLINSKKKILQIVSSYPPADKFGGGSKMMYKYATILSKKNKVDVYTTNVKNDNLTISNNEMIKSTKRFNIYYFKTFNSYLSSVYNFNFSISLIYNLIKYINNYDYVHLAEIRGPFPLITSLLLRSNKSVKLIHSSFGMLDSKTKSSFKNFFRLIYDKLFLNILLNRIDIVLTENEKEKLTYLKLGI